MTYWLLKSEEDVYSIDDMAKEKTTLWENIRNYQARNYMTTFMKPGDVAFFYHSNSQPTGIAGLVEIAGTAVVDPHQFEKKNEYYDPKSKKEKPTWFCVPVKFKEKFPRVISLEELKKQKNLAKMVLLNNSRLSVQPVAKDEFEAILELL
jgi:predicted RNA-binding protein with PUA-like domain